MRPAAKYSLVACAYLVVLILVASAAFLVVIFLAGPHAGLLPQPLEVAAGIAGWLSVLIVPVIGARAVWRRMK